jgi:hypothetical protein
LTAGGPAGRGNLISECLRRAQPHRCYWAAMDMGASSMIEKIEVAGKK